MLGHLRRLCSLSLVSVAVLLWVSRASATPRDEVEAAYARSALAMQLKYLDGVASIRAPGYRLVSSEGLNLDLEVERSRLDLLLGPVLRVTESVLILQFTPLSPERAQSRVRYVTVLVSMDPVAKKEVRRTVVTECQDEWRMLGSRWLLFFTRVVKQEVS